MINNNGVTAFFLAALVVVGVPLGFGLSKGAEFGEVTYACHRVQIGEGVTVQAGIMTEPNGYVCAGSDGSTVVQVDHAQGDKMELITSSNGAYKVQRRPAERLGDLIKGAAVDLNEWKFDADRERIQDGNAYFKQAAFVYEGAKAFCGGGDAVWYGRLDAAGKVRYSTVATATEAAKCVDKRLREVGFNAPPASALYDMDGGYPLTF